MKIALFGATGYIGSSILENILPEHALQVLVRDPSKLKTNDPRLKVVAGHLGEAEKIREVVAGCDAVIWAVGATKNPQDRVEVYTTAFREVLAAARTSKVRRLLVLSGAAMIIPGENATLPRRIMQLLLKLFLKTILATNRQVYALLDANRDLDWTVIRPAYIPHGKPAGAVRFDPEGMVGYRIDVADLGLAFALQLNDDTYRHRAPFVASGS